MSNINETAQAAAASEPPRSPTLLETVMTALEVTGRLTAETAAPTHPLYNRDTVKDLYVEAHAGGYVANIGFDLPPGHPNIIGTPDRSPFPTQGAAFLAGARMLCHLLTGSTELPFIIRGDELIVFACSA